MPAGRTRRGWADQRVNTSTGALVWAGSTTQQRQITERKVCDQLIPPVRPHSAALSSWKPQLTSQNKRPSGYLKELKCCKGTHHTQVNTPYKVLQCLLQDQGVPLIYSCEGRISSFASCLQLLWNQNYPLQQFVDKVYDVGEIQTYK